MNESYTQTARLNDPLVDSLPYQFFIIQTPKGQLAKQPQGLIKGPGVLSLDGLVSPKRSLSRGRISAHFVAFVGEMKEKVRQN